MRINAVQTIKDRLTMRNILEHYGYSTKKRIPCPLHNGKDENFSYKEDFYKCFSCGASGDIISFVQKLFNLSFSETLRKIDTDFGLNIYGDHTFDELRRSHYQQMAVQAKREREKREKDCADAEYWEAFDEWKRLDENFRKYKPKSYNEELHPLFVEALQKLDYQKYLLAILDMERDKYV